ncbi:MAG: ankyrin repeat domain-containing protein [Bryobacteraceae bacterium]
MSLLALMELVYGGGHRSPRPSEAAALLDAHPELTAGDAWLACVPGDEGRIAKALEANAAWVNEPNSLNGMTPLTLVTFNGLLSLPRYAEPLRRCAALLLESGADPNQTWDDPAFPNNPLSALYGAAGKNHDFELTKLLLAAGANPNDNESLYHSLETADPTCTELLLAAGAKVTGTNSLFHVLDDEKPDRLRMLLAHGGDANESSSYLNRPLHHAIRRGRSAEVIRILLDAGADPKAATNQGMTAYRMALRYGMPEVADELAARGAEETLSESEQLLASCARGIAGAPGSANGLSHDQLTMLPEMAQSGNAAAVKAMVLSGWPVAMRGGDWNATALNFAVFRGDPEMTAFLLAHGARWEERHGYNDNVVGTLSFGSRERPEEGGDWVGCARALIAAGMPLPADHYQFGPDVSTYFGEVRRTL